MGDMFQGDEVEVLMASHGGSEGMGSLCDMLGMHKRKQLK